MKYFSSLFFSLFVFVHSGLSQSSEANPMSFDVYRIYPALSFPIDTFNKAETIIDVNDRFKPEWVKEYVSVEFTASKSGKTYSATGTNQYITDEQKYLVQHADVNTKILVKVNYYPDNNLSQNDIQEERFAFHIDPENEAQFAGEHSDLLAYFKQKVIDEIPEDLFGLYTLAAVAFTVNAEGDIVDVNIAMPTGDAVVDTLIYDAVCKMDKWKPAQYKDGKRAEQEFAFTVGNMKSCNTNLINIRAGLRYEDEN